MRKYIVSVDGVTTRTNFIVLGIAICYRKLFRLSPIRIIGSYVQ